MDTVHHNIYRAPEGGGVQYRASDFQILGIQYRFFSCFEYRIFGKPVSEIETQYRISFFSKATIPNLRSLSNIGFSKLYRKIPLNGPKIV